MPSQEMDISQEAEPIDNSNNNENKDTQNKLETNAEAKNPAKKKFNNTVFATKMKNRKEEERLRKLKAAEVLSSCKQVSIEVTRLASNAVPKIISAVENKTKKKKRSQWKLGIEKRRKKSADKNAKKTGVKNEKKSINETSKLGTEKSEKIIIEPAAAVAEEDSKSNPLENKDETSRRKSLRSVTSMATSDEKSDLEVKPDVSSVSEETFTCRRTEPFVGKLNTKEVRALNIERILQEGGVATENNETVGDSSKDAVPKSKDDQTPDKILNEAAKSKVNESKKGKGNKSKDSDKNVNATPKENEKETLDQELTKSVKEVVETKEKTKVEESNCSRTMPFVGKTIRKPKSGVPERPIEIDGSLQDVRDERQNDRSESTACSSTAAGVNKKSESDAKTVNRTSRSTRSKTLSISQDDSVKSPAQENLVPPLQNASTEPTNEVMTEDLQDSSAKTKETVTTHPDQNQKKDDILEQGSSSEVLSNEITLKSKELAVNDDKKLWSCQRAEPYAGRKTRSIKETGIETSGVQTVDEIQHQAASAEAAGVSIESGASTDSSEVVDLPKEVADRLAPMEIDDKSDDPKVNEDENIPVHKEGESVIPAIDSTPKPSEKRKSDSPVLNGEWKFKRKRQKTVCETDLQSNESFTSKKTRGKSLSETRTPISKKSTPLPETKTPTSKKSTPTVSPAKTICSLFSLNCTKHDHQHEHVKSGESVKPTTTEKSNVSVVLIRLEDTDDPAIQVYLKKTDLEAKTKARKISESKSEVENEKPKIHSRCESRVSSVNEPEQVAKDDRVPAVASEVTSSDVLPEVTETENVAKKEVEDLSSGNESIIALPSTIRRRTLSGSSSGSSVIQAKRKKAPVNYLENFSDSDDTSTPLKKRSQSRGPSLRTRNKERTYSELDSEDNSMEVEGLSGMTSRLRTRSKAFDDSKQDIPDGELNWECSRTSGVDSPKKNLLSRPKSVMGKKIEVEPENQISSKNQYMGVTTDQAEMVSSTQNEGETDLDKEVAEFSRNQPRSRNPSVEVHKSPTPEPEESCSDQQVFSTGLKTPTSDSNKLPSTPKSSVKKDNVVTSERKSRVSRIDELLSTPTKVPATPNLTEMDSPRSTRSDVSKTAKRIKINELVSFSESPSSTDIPSTEQHKSDVGLERRDLKVQLIKLEAVCSSFKEYSASEIELLTNKYIDVLMNSNFTCNTWKTPISYYQPIDKQAEEVDNSDCIMDAETQEMDEVESTNETEQSDDGPTVEPIFVSVQDQAVIASPQRTPKKIEHLAKALLRSPKHATVTLDDQTSSDESVTRVESAVKSPVKQAEKAQEAQGESPVLLDETESGKEDQAQTTNQDSEAILVNGTEMFACTTCNKIFIGKTLLDQHVAQDHNDTPEGETSASDTAAVVNNSSIETSTASIAGESTSVKKSSKSKKKHRYSENLRCTICTVLFDTKELLFDHIMTHSEKELQLAYRAAKAKSGGNDLSEESDQERAKSKKDDRKNTDDGQNKSSNEDDDLIIEETSSTVGVVGPVDQLSSDTQAGSAGNPNAIVTRVPSSLQGKKPITICACHAHESTEQDLQIEMVLLCKICRVLFRRRDCFEVHYRQSPECRRKRTNNEITRIPKLFCSGCPRILASLQEMRTHLEEHAHTNCHGTVSFICNICKVGFFGVGGIFYSHWFNHTKSPNFVASRYSFPKLSVVSALEDSNGIMAISKSQEGYFYIAEHVCRECRLPFSSDPELQRHKLQPCRPATPPRTEAAEASRQNPQMIKLICDLCKKYYVKKDDFDKHCEERNHLKTPITKFSRMPVNANEQVFVCSLCRSISNTLDEMKEHWKRIHSPIMELYTCKTCNVVPSNDVTNYTYDKFEKHCRMAHKSEVITCLVYFVTARYVCNICKFGFETEKSMKEHEVIHQTNGTENRTVQPLTVPPTAVSIPLETQTTTLYVTEPPQSDGGRRIHPVYVQYGVNGSVNQQMTVPTSTQNLLAIQNQSLVNPVLSTSVAAPINNSQVNSSGNAVLRTMLSNLTVQQSLQQQQNIPLNPVEEILLDSRSNSPILQTPSTSTSNNTSGNDAAAAKKSYMTMVNPNFETMLSPNVSANNSPQPDQDKSNSTDTDSSTPQPFEVVLVTDDLSENSNSDITIERSIERTMESDDSSFSNQHQQDNEVKPLLRVKTIAELQDIKIHLCSVCGFSFNTAQDYEHHMKQQHPHQKMVTEAGGRTTPVMIPPLQSGSNSSPNTVTNKSSKSDPHSYLISQIKQKMAGILSTAPATQSKTTVSTSVPRTTPTVTQNKPQSQIPRMNSTVVPSQSGPQRPPLRVSPSVTTSNTHLSKPPRTSPIVQNQTQPLTTRMSPAVAASLTNPPTTRMSAMSRHQQSQYWFAQSNGTINRTVTTYSVQNRPQAQAGFLRGRLTSHASNSTAFSSRGPPPPYVTPNAIVNRPGAIQLPERNASSSGMPTAKRPSGAATRIPQSSMTSMDSHSSDNRQPVSSAWDYGMNSLSPYGTDGLNSSNSSLMRQQNTQVLNKTYPSNSINYASSISNSSYNMMQQPQQSQGSKSGYSCKYTGCDYRSETLAIIRMHEKTHEYSQRQTATTSVSQQQQQAPQQQQQQQQQQQRLPVKHVSVSQMPERTRHALPTARPPVVNNVDKRFLCRICNICTNTNTELIEHMAKSHASATAQVCCYVCDYCPTPLLFDSEDKLRKHMHISHNHSCEVCKKRYPSKEDLMMHMEVHIRAT